MKNRKKQFLKIGIAVLVIAVAGIVAGVVRYRIDNRFDLTVGGHTISKDEYVNCRTMMPFMKMASGRKSMMGNTATKF